MATKPLGAGTCNLSVNVRQSVRSALGRLAFRIDVSMGELVRRLIAVGAALASLHRKLATERERAQQLAQQIRRITADGKVTAEEIVELNRDCAPAADQIADGCDRVGTRLTLEPMEAHV